MNPGSQGPRFEFGPGGPNSIGGERSPSYAPLFLTTVVVGFLVWIIDNALVWNIRIGISKGQKIIFSRAKKYFVSVRCSYVDLFVGPGWPF